MKRKPMDSGYAFSVWLNIILFATVLFAVSIAHIVADERDRYKREAMAQVELDALLTEAAYRVMERRDSVVRAECEQNRLRCLR